MDAYKAQHRHLLGLDVIRFTAAVSVAWYHLAFWSWASPPDLPFRASGGLVSFHALAPFAWWGWSGVETFFVLSGFVICASAERSTAYVFLRGRIARLYPAVWLCAPITAVVALAIGLEPLETLRGDFLRSLAIWPAGPWVDSVYRTLIVEGVFYALMLGLLAVSGFRRIEAVAVMLGGCSLAFWLVGSCVDLHRVAPLAILNFLKYGIFFALGMMVWVAKRYGGTRTRLAVIAVLALCGTFEVYLVALGMAPYLPSLSAIAAAAIWVAILAVLLLTIGFDAVLRRHLAAWARPLRTIGLMTYPFYLLHDVVGAAILRSSTWVGSGVALVLAFAVTLALAWLVVQAEPRLRRPLVAALDGLANMIRARARPTRYRTEPDSGAARL